MMGKLIDVLGSKKTCAVNVIVLLGVMATSIACIESRHFDWYSYLNCFMWGMMDGCVSTHSMQIVGFEFTDCTNPFAVYQMVYSASIFSFLLISGNFREDTDDQFYHGQFGYTIIMGVLGLISFISCSFFDFYQMETIEDKVKRFMREKKNGRAESMARNTLGGFGGNRSPAFSVTGLDPKIDSTEQDYLDKDIDKSENRALLLASHQAQIAVSNMEFKGDADLHTPHKDKEGYVDDEDDESSLGSVGITNQREQVASNYHASQLAYHQNKEYEVRGSQFKLSRVSDETDDIQIWNVSSGGTSALRASANPDSGNNSLSTVMVPNRRDLSSTRVGANDSIRGNTSLKLSVKNTRLMEKRKKFGLSDNNNPQSPLTTSGAVPDVLVNASQDLETGAGASEDAMYLQFSSGTGSRDNSTKQSPNFDEADQFKLRQRPSNT